MTHLCPTHLCPTHGNPLHADGRPWDDTQCRPAACWERFGLVRPDLRGTDLLPPRRVAVDPTTLVTQPNGFAFNPSLARHNGRWLMAYRTGWAGSRIAACEVDPENGVCGPSRVLDLRHPRIAVGAEDPRLWIWRGQLHVSFTAWDGRNAHVLYAGLTDSLGVERVFAPHWECRAPWEKNWAFFEGQDGGLFCVYSVDPHIVLRVDGERCEAAGQTACPIKWTGGYLRGGCPPVLHDGEYWHWFHGCRDAGEPNRRYSVGLYTFEPTPPFRITRHLSEPVAWASDHDFARSGNYCRVAFPGGAVLDRGRWHLGVGVHDRWCEVWGWDHAELRGRLGMPRFRGRCLHIGPRVEFREGCGGWSCAHRCEAGEPVAVPGGVCQGCPRWEAE